jgi:hypothetical protein
MTADWKIEGWVTIIRKERLDGDMKVLFNAVTACLQIEGFFILPFSFKCLCFVLSYDK